MVKPPSHIPSKEDSHDKLIEAAISLFASKGYDGTSVKDIADAAGVNVSLISYYFQGKEGLYAKCLEHFGKGFLDNALESLQVARSAEEVRIRLEIFAENFLKSHSERKEVTCIIHREFQFSNSAAKAVFEEVFLKAVKVIIGFFENAMKNGWLRNAPPQETAALFLGGLIHMARVDQLNKSFFGNSIESPEYRSLIARTAVENLFYGLKADRS